MLSFLTFLILLVITIAIATNKNHKNIDEKIREYNKNQKERKEFRDWFNSQNKKAEEEVEIKLEGKYYCGEDWKERKGRDYEFYVAKFYENEGYLVKNMGYAKGKLDEGIDLEAHKDREVILIQCKHWKNRAELKDILKFYNDSRRYEKKYRYKFLGKDIKKFFIISNAIKNREIDEFLEKINNEIEFIYMPAKNYKKVFKK